MNWMKSKAVRTLSLVFGVQAIILYTTVSRAEIVPAVRPLFEFPTTFGSWSMVRDVPIEKEVQDILKADDTLNRVYVNPDYHVEADLFIGFFKTQRTGQSPHSPKNCLPGSGWEPTQTGLVSISVPGLAEPIVANRYVASHGDEKAVVIYWYQSHQRIIASEYAAKFWLVADSIRYHRSDTALVKLVLPVPNNDADAATRIGVDLARAVFPDLEKQLPR
ncbi:MAG TPA: EpsI family protein [Bryobacteraceae bacterium]|jgi:EpsI family protein|nr:EpsI family protein [Bryobacteraceae bacterium]